MQKIIAGTVLSMNLKKTVIVSVERKFRHPLYKKTLIRHKKYKVHNEDIPLKEGDVVRIKESKPISKEKHFIVIEKLSA
ncbi:30S ribosomal protein S17 [Candidatus Roizmanbacteria bacterium]|nr:30S ribosomal protein S17 [Candidatus Roizmanbacteria bacterium]